MEKKSDERIMSDMLVLLNACAALALSLDKDAAGTGTALEELIAKVEPQQGAIKIGDQASGLVEDAAIRAIRAGPDATHLYLVLLPPDSGPNFEDCPTCHGKRVQGTNK
ncbi:hypothetical protein [Agrobacterium radiobacter]|uniref:hypothetical protein n=1 Tax=Agrobacterium radiobacter TaxID=362 RepID=UPI003F8547C1